MKQDQIVIYKDENNAIQLEVRMDGEMIWLTRQQLATLFGRDYKTISKHINNALKEELADEVVVAKFANTTQHGAIEGKTQTHEKEYFNLEMVTSVGYRVKSKRGVQFRKWANRILKQYLIKGYAVNERIRKEQIGELRQMVQVIGRKSLTVFQLVRLKSRAQSFWLRAASLAFRSFLALLLASLPILSTLFCQAFKPLAELSLLAVHVFDSLSLQT